jgi:hypothetical protein
MKPVPVPDKSDKPDKGAADNSRAEYAALRAEIQYSDQVCLLLTGALLSGSVSLLTYALDKNRSFLALFLSPVWLIGYLYMTEKRSVIETIATYLRERIEKERPGFGWETWLRDRNQVRSRFRRVFPYLIETVVSAAATVLIPLFILWNNHWRLTWDFYAAAFFIPVMIVLEYRNYEKYRKRATKA